MARSTLLLLKPPSPLLEHPIIAPKGFILNPDIAKRFKFANPQKDKWARGRRSPIFDHGALVLAPNGQERWLYTHCILPLVAFYLMLFLY